MRQVEVEAQPTRLILSSWILSFRVSTPYIIIPVTYNTYIAYIKANLIDLSDLVFFGSDRSPRRGDLVRACVCDIIQNNSENEF